MTKNPLFIVLFLCTFSFSFAQTVGIGIKGGINYNNIGDFSSIGGSIGTGVANINYEADNEIGTQFGLFISVHFEKFFIRPEVNYVSFNNSYPFPASAAKWTATQIDIPFLFGYNIYKPVNIFAGPVFSLISDMDLEGWQDTSYADPFVYKSSAMSVSVGILLDFGIVGIDFRYQYGITNVIEQRLDMIKSTYGVNLGDLTAYNPSQLMLSVQIKPFTIGGDKRNKRSGSDWRNHKNL